MSADERAARQTERKQNRAKEQRREKLKKDLDGYLKDVDNKQKEIRRLEGEQRRLQQSSRKASDKDPDKAEALSQELNSKDSRIQQKIVLGNREADALFKEIAKVRAELEQPEFLTEDELREAEARRREQQFNELQRTVELMQEERQREKDEKQALSVANERLQRRVEELCGALAATKDQPVNGTANGPVPQSEAAAGGLSRLPPRQMKVAEVAEGTAGTGPPRLSPLSAGRLHSPARSAGQPQETADGEAIRGSNAPAGPGVPTDAVARAPDQRGPNSGNFQAAPLKPTFPLGSAAPVLSTATAAAAGGGARVHSGPARLPSPGLSAAPRLGVRSVRSPLPNAATAPAPASAQTPAYRPSRNGSYPQVARAVPLIGQPGGSQQTALRNAYVASPRR